MKTPPPAPLIPVLAKMVQSRPGTIPVPVKITIPVGYCRGAHYISGDTIVISGDTIVGTL